MENVFLGSPEELMILEAEIFLLFSFSKNRENRGKRVMLRHDRKEMSPPREFQLFPMYGPRQNS